MLPLNTIHMKCSKLNFKYHWSHYFGPLATRYYPNSIWVCVVVTNENNRLKPLPNNVAFNQASKSNSLLFISSPLSLTYFVISSHDKGVLTSIEVLWYPLLEPSSQDPTIVLIAYLCSYLISLELGCIQNSSTFPPMCHPPVAYSLQNHLHL